MLTKLNPFIIENIKPSVDGGRYPVKREVGDTVKVTATVFREGHDLIRVLLCYRLKNGGGPWHKVPMVSVNPGLDLWEGTFIVDKNSRYQYTIEAYTDVYESWLKDTSKKFDSGQDVSSELIEGKTLLDNVSVNINNEKDKAVYAELMMVIGQREDFGERLRAMSDTLVLELVREYAVRGDAVCYESPLEIIVDRVRARYASWYEMFPRSQGTDPSRSATFKECAARLPEIQALGFDVLYLTPIHPIGITKRKGPNNSLLSGPDDPGCPYAMGNDTGGHKAVEPSLGTMEDFLDFERECKSHGMEIALDFAINCSPDHPYVKAHPEWFFKRPDGTIKYAENPPKKYEDIYPLNFYAEGDSWKALWEEMRDIILFWSEKGVRIFRVDNPHTKPVPFWQWLIGEVQDKYPDTIFLAEAFTRPPMMRALAKAGYTQSYTYFTWRNFKHEITEYFTELTQSGVSEYMRGNLFVNTPDILPQVLQVGGRPAFKMRFALAATLSSTYGIYNGYELCENAGLEGKEEYLNSEKYQFKVWDWERPGNIKNYIKKINRIRRENPALHLYKNLRFYKAENENILFYGKSTPSGENIILVAVNLDPFKTHESKIYVPISEYKIDPEETYELHNLITGERLLSKGQENWVSINPEYEPALIFKLQKWVHKEETFDYFGM